MREEDRVSKIASGSADLTGEQLPSPERDEVAGPFGAARDVTRELTRPGEHRPRNCHLEFRGDPASAARRPGLLFFPSSTKHGAMHGTAAQCKGLESNDPPGRVKDTAPSELQVQKQNNHGVLETTCPPEI